MSSGDLRNPLLGPRVQLPPPRPGDDDESSHPARSFGPPISLAASRVDIDPEAQDALEKAAEAKRTHRRELVGLGYNALSTVFGTGMSLFAKVSGRQGIGVFEIVLTRSLILVLFTGPELLYFKTNPFRDRNRRWLLVLRGVLGFMSVSSLYLAVSLLPLADASVLAFLSPIFVAALSPFILRERSSLGVLFGIPVAMVGVILVAQPSFIPWFGGGGISTLGVIVGIFQALFNSLARMSVRALSVGSSERMASIIFGQGAISCLGAGIMCAATRKFVVPTQAPVWGALLAGGFLGYLYQLALTAGLQRARAAPAVAMSYLSVIWGILADIFLFHDLPDALSLVGAAIICCSSLFVAISQRRQAVAAKAAAEAAAAAAEASVHRARAARLRQASAAAGGGTLQRPLLLGSDEMESDSEDEGSGELPAGRSRAASSRARSLAAAGSREDWASAAEGGLSMAASLRTAPSWHTAGEGEEAEDEGEGGALPALKADLKEALAAAAARDAAAEVAQPDTPAAPLHLQPTASAESLPPLGSSPGAVSQLPPLSERGSGGGAGEKAQEDGG
ncbi:hypothetical protein ABPG75_010663 [Micractinium tetrahymenae]